MVLNSLQVNQNNIRNFAIIAHVDHGKSTLADRLLEVTNTIEARNMRSQYLDSNPIERERGITIKLAPVRMKYPFEGQEYDLNLIDTPGHVDFSYEVVRTLYACEGAVLLVDATKGIQAQTVANYNFAKKLGLKVIPAINKIDLPLARVEEVEHDLVESLGFERSQILYISAKTGEGVSDLLASIIKNILPPDGKKELPTQAYIFDSEYDEHRGIVIYIRVKNGEVKKGDEIVFCADGASALVLGVGYLAPEFSSQDALSNGEVGYIITNIKDITQAKVGDTITTRKDKGEALSGFMQLKPFVYLSIYPTSNSEFQVLRKAVFKLKMNDASLVVSPEHSQIFGPGFRCGFLGLLHSQIVLERLEKEGGVGVFSAPPTIEYIVDGKSITSPKDFNNESHDIKEPYINGEIYTPSQYLGSILEIINKKKGVQKDVVYYGSQVKVLFEMPLSSVVYDFYDKIKSASSGFASFDYEISEFRNADLVRVDIGVNEQIIPELSFIVHKSEVETFSRRIVEELSRAIPRHQFIIAVRAQIGAKIIASEKISALRKDVTAKLYGGDRTRKDKLLEAQKKGKQKMKSIGNINIPKEAFLSVLKV
ncbi:MAG: elongation factor 4 [Candidatus Levybacteria bacterium CG_4_10_14_0_2_um_filter_36_16]|nr:MAG: elongation factor 4 [Candidatus Levybacteria bacterium CG10_big_fil_rev_8_21_14_0_10_36_30]PIZ97787.1 MAG: elongation factor 4 [Candidatus Levybacteria bacterium CG_4_10_14_0_2_um_filter_36_16]